MQFVTGCHIYSNIKHNEGLKAFGGNLNNGITKKKQLPH